jgi:haloacetate dehalogenase
MAASQTLEMPPLIPHGRELMPGFERRRIATSGAQIEVAVAGSGPPLPLLHGNPLTLVSWHKVAPSLAQSFTVVATDLRGYGDSSKPAGGGDHSAYSFRTMALDNVEVMARLGFSRFAVAGHDRGARVAFRMCLDHPEKVERMASLDIVPTHHVLTNMSVAWGINSYHWFFLAQKAPYPERLISNDLDFYISTKLDKPGVGLDIFTPEALAEYKRCTTPDQIHAVCEDYRATLGVDFEMDKADFGHRQIACPVLHLWGAKSHVGKYYDPVAAWAPWCRNVRGWALPTGHYPAEHRPDLVHAAFWQFFSGLEPTPYAGPL